MTKYFTLSQRIHTRHHWLTSRLKKIILHIFLVNNTDTFRNFIHYNCILTELNSFPNCDMRIPGLGPPGPGYRGPIKG